MIDRLLQLTITRCVQSGDYTDRIFGLLRALPEIGHMRTRVSERNGMSKNAKLLFADAYTFFLPLFRSSIIYLFLLLARRLFLQGQVVTFWDPKDHTSSDKISKHSIFFVNYLSFR